ncbi:hypothetical protein E2562_023047 [Oryza meyeriana var. granulata]|uniref:Uncharacterized protein n=1 Tax=Oryza meyeriana var. granulata TaxID=110450 RepID=A0A6G1EYN7_9ORYZ|nr:hypothetical protein E2562_023047 [Oryza meyeriana var. granulata]
MVAGDKNNGQLPLQMRRLVLTGLFITRLKKKRKGKERQELQTMVVNQEEQEMPTEQEVLLVKPLAQLSPLKEVRQSLILKKKSKIHHRTQSSNSESSD